MSQRYGPASDNRFPRDRSPQRNAFNGVHPSRAGNVESRAREGMPAPADAPRGPRASNESFRGPYGGPRGRGVGRGDFRFDYRERDSFRRDASPPGAHRDFRGGRGWSPVSDRFSSDNFRDSHDQARDLEFGRGGRGRYRDSAPGRHVESRGGHSFFPAREDGPRGRGQFYHPRGRGRGHFHEERGGFRGRSPSPPGRNRWARSPSPTRDRRPAPDRFDDERFERRNSEKSYDRDDRFREEDRLRGGDRYQPGPSPTTPSSYRPSNAFSQNTARPGQDFERELFPSRRVSATTDVPTARDRGYDSFRPDVQSKRDNQRPENRSSRPSSPPRPPEVPAFGSLPSKTPVAENPPWNKWIAPELKQNQQMRQMPQVSQVSPPSPPRPPSAPKGPSSQAHLSEAKPPAPQEGPQAPEQRPSNVLAGGNDELQTTSPRLEPQDIAPKAPKAERRNASPAGSEVSDLISRVKAESPRVSTSAKLPSTHHDATMLSASAQRPPMTSRELSPMALRSPPTGPKMQTALPSGPKASLSPSLNRTSLASGGFNPPSGPRSNPLGSSPVPTAPPTAPRAVRASSFNSRPPFAANSYTPRLSRRGDHAIESNTGSLAVPAKRELSSERSPAETQTAPQTTQTSDVHAGYSDLPQVSHDEPGEWPSSKRQKIEHDRAPSSADKSQSGKGAGYVSEEDAMDIEDDSERREREYQESRARVASRMVDLSARSLRGCSPLRELDLLARLVLEDFSTFFEAPRSRKSATQRVTTRDEAKSPKPAEEIQMPDRSQPEQVTEEKEFVRPPRTPKPPPKYSPSPISSPELRSLPFLNVAPLTPISELDTCQENLKRHELIKNVLADEISRQQEYQDIEEEELCRQYEHHYRIWRHHVMNLDIDQKARENGERHDTVDAAIPQSATETSPPLPTPGESRRRGMHATDYELEKVLEMSKMEAEREAKEKQERDAANAKPNWELEASIPALVSTKDTHTALFDDTSCLRNPTQMVLEWDLEPDEDDFTQEEHDTMLQNFKDFPKKFGKIAEGLGGRDYKECINHYYATKWNGQYKPPRDKRRKAKVPRTKSGLNARPRANALLSNLNDDSKPDLYDGDDAVAPLNAFTESGRPKRAAAPTFKDKDPQADPLNPGTPVKKNGKADATVEKSGRKARTTGKDVKQRRPRARRDSRSPEKTDMDVTQFDRLQVPSANELEVANSLNNLRQPLMPPSTHANALVIDQAQARAALGPEAGKIQPVRGASTTGTSSYWSVQEVELFPQLVEKYGTDWPLISQEMGTKTQTMVKNYFHRLKAKNLDIERSARDADEKRGRSEQTATVATPKASSRKAKEEEPCDQCRGTKMALDGQECSACRGSGTKLRHIQPIQTRPLAPTTASEVIELDDDEQAAPVAPSTRNPVLESLNRGYPRHENTYAPTLHRRTGSNPQPFTTAPAVPSNAPVSQTTMYEPVGFASRERDPVATAPTPAAVQYAPHSRSSTMDYGPFADLQPSLSRPTYQPVRPGVEDVMYRPHNRMVPPPAHPDPPAMYGPAPTVASTLSRRQPVERSLSDDVHQIHQRVRPPSPSPQSSIRHLMGDLSNRPQSTSYLDPGRGGSSSLPREEIRAPSRPVSDRPPPPAAAPPKRSNLMSILNDEPSDPPPAPAPMQPPQRPPSNQPPPFVPGTASSSFQPPRPASRVEYAPREHVRKSSVGSYGSAFLPHGQPTTSRPVLDSRQLSETSRLHPGTFHITWPPQDEPLPQQRNAPEPAPYDHRPSLRQLDRQLDKRYNPSPPPMYGPVEGSGSGHNSPFNQRLSLHHIANRHEPSPPPARSYSFAPPSTHSRDTSISHLNPERRAPPPSVLQPSHAPRPSVQQQPPSIMQPGMRSRPDSTAAFPARDYPAYPPSDLQSRPLYGSRPSDTNHLAQEHNAKADARYESERPRVWGMPPPREEERDTRRVADWTQGLPREPRYEATYGPAGGTSTPAPAQPQYAPYQPPSDRRDERGR